MLGEKSPRVRVSTVHVQELLGVFLPRLKRVHFTNSDLNIKITLYTNPEVNFIFKKCYFPWHSSDLWDRVGEFRGQTERYIYPGQYVGHRRR